MASTPASSSSTPPSSSTPQPQFSASVASHASGSSASKIAKANRPKTMNVFTNDGSFLERFQRSKKEEEEKKKLEEDAMRKRNFEDRFKRRGKRLAPDSSDSNTLDDHLSKRLKPEKEKDKEADIEKPLTQYEREVKSYAGRSLKDDGIGIRPLVK